MILIAIGSNLGHAGRDPLAVCEAAWREVEALVASRFGPVAPPLLSPWFDTRAVPVSSQPDYVNGVAAFAPRPGVAVDPAALLAGLQAIEARFGRARSVPDAARTLDLDIVAIGDLVRDAPDPILPHPRCHLRRFVLEPLACVAPGWRHPGLGEGVEALLAALPDQGVARRASRAALETGGPAL